MKQLTMKDPNDENTSFVEGVWVSDLQPQLCSNDAFPVGLLHTLK